MPGSAEQVITTASVIPWGSLYAVAFTMGSRRGAVLVGDKEEAELTAAAAIGQGPDFISELTRKSVSRARAELL